MKKKIIDLKFLNVSILFIFVIHGGLAQLARAPRWQRGGHRFESDILHYYLLHLHIRIFKGRPILHWPVPGFTKKT